MGDRVGTRRRALLAAAISSLAACSRTDPERELRAPPQLGGRVELIIVRAGSRQAARGRTVPRPGRTDPPRSPAADRACVLVYASEGGMIARWLEGGTIAQGVRLAAETGGEVRISRN